MVRRGGSCPYCLAGAELLGGPRARWEHIKVHKILRHRIVPVRITGNIFNAVKGAETTLTVLQNL